MGVHLQIHSSGLGEDQLAHCPSWQSDASCLREGNVCTLGTPAHLSNGTDGTNGTGGIVNIVERTPAAEAFCLQEPSNQ